MWCVRETSIRACVLSFFPSCVIVTWRVLRGNDPCTIKPRKCAWYACTRGRCRFEQAAKVDAVSCKAANRHVIMLDPCTRQNETTRHHMVKKKSQQYKQFEPKPRIFFLMMYKFLISSVSGCSNEWTRNQVTISSLHSANTKAKIELGKSGSPHITEKNHQRMRIQWENTVYCTFTIVLCFE